MIYMAKPQIGDEEKKAVMEVLDSSLPPPLRSSLRQTAFYIPEPNQSLWISIRAHSTRM